MKILTAAQIREADRQTILEEQIASVDLMERAAQAFTNWFTSNFALQNKSILILCGPGNNGGDGLAVARLLHQKNVTVTVWIVAPEEKYSADFIQNQHCLPAEIPVENLTTDTIPQTDSFDFILDGLLGTGLSRPVTGIFAAVIKQINNSPAGIIAIDIPSGLFSEQPQDSSTLIVQADYTCSFELPKLAFFLPQNAPYVGTWHVEPIGLSPTYLQSAETDKHLITPALIKSFLKKRGRFSHKGTYGHALLLAGSYGKIGAAVLASRACLRSGVGLLSVACPQVGYAILQTSVPEAMTIPDNNPKHISQLPDLSVYQAIGAGPGLDKAPETRDIIRKLLTETPVPLILDADALNILSENETMLAQLPKNTILTPHPKEFERLAGPAADDYQRLALLQQFCHKYTCYVVLKGGHTCIGTPEGNLYFNDTGNPGMATGGTGDVLTGIITSLVAQKYSALEACLLGVYMHGLAGDIVKTRIGEIALLASDLIETLGEAFLQLEPNRSKEITLINQEV